MSGWPRGHQPRNRGCSWMSSWRCEIGTLEHRAEHPVRARQRAHRRDQLLAHTADEETAKAAVAVGDPERRIPRAGKLASVVDEALEHLVDRQLRRYRQDCVTDRPQRGAEVLGHRR